MDKGRCCKCSQLYLAAGAPADKLCPKCSAPPSLVKYTEPYSEPQVRFEEPAAKSGGLLARVARRLGWLSR